jgi:SAM-dependent methyltransferase
MRFDGVRQILRFNVHLYGAGLALLAAMAFAWRLHAAPRPALALATGLTAFWIAASLAVSWYVYDCARVTAWQWLAGILPFAPARWLNIHAGLDESTTVLKHLYRGSEQAVLDNYDAAEMTEPSIARARRLHAAQPALRAPLDVLPFQDSSQDAVFLLFAAHEVRHHARRVALLREIRRVLAPDGRVVLVEHLRDWKNFAAFGPGFLHFFSRREWLSAAAEAGLHVDSESSVTPFVRCLVLGV